MTFTGRSCSIRRICLASKRVFNPNFAHEILDFTKTGTVYITQTPRPKLMTHLRVRVFQIRLDNDDYDDDDTIEGRANGLRVHR